MVFSNFYTFIKQQQQQQERAIKCLNVIE